jgi:serine/threonine-protein kinase
VQALFHEAADLPESERPAFVERECGDDAALRSEVLALLAEDARGGSLLDRGLKQVAHQVLNDPAVLPTHRFGPYRVLRVLGEGGMGVVYLAEREDLGSLAAVKLLRDAWLSPARRERFASEQRTLAHLNHPSIARLYDADTMVDGTPWFVMEYVEGVPLTNYCAAHGSSIRDRLQLLRAVCEAVQHAHRHLVVHRDLKPSNILVTADGSVKLLDFGIAKQLEGLEAPIEQTRTGLRLMTPAYAAPEQIRAGRIGIHTDVYSLGVVLYELLVGRLPFDLTDKTPGEIEAIVTEREPERPSVAARRMTALAGGKGPMWPGSKSSAADLDVLCLTAMHKDPQRRYRTVEALIRDIDHYLNAQPLEARPDTLGYRVGKFVRRNWRAVAATTVAFAAVLALVIFYTVRLATARNTAVAEAERTQRIQGFMMKLFEGGDEEIGPTDTLRVVTLIDRGVQEARSLDAEPAVQAELYQTLGGIYQKLGNFAQADSLLRFSLERRKVIFGPEHPEVAKSLVALGTLRVDQAEYEEAEQLIREGLAMSLRDLPAGHPDVARATEALGQVLTEKGDNEQAIKVLEQLVQLRSPAGPNSADMASALYELANAHFYAGHYAESDSLNRQVMAIYRQLYGDRHPLIADALTNLGASQFDLGHYVEAEKYFRQALELTQATYGPNHYKTAADLTMLGRALVFEKRDSEAIDMLKQALAIRERVYGPVHPSVASTLNELGNIAYAHDSLDEAEGYYKRMVDIYRKVYHDHHFRIGIAMANLAGVYMDRKEYSRAEKIYREVLERYKTTLEPNNINVGITTIKLGRSLLRQGRFAEASRESLAGYQILITQTDPAVSFLRAARKDLIAAYDSMGQPEKAVRFRAELADTAAPRAN